VRLAFGALFVTLAVALPAVAKRADFFSLDLQPRPTHASAACGAPVQAARATAGSSIRATVTLRHGGRSATATPFVIAVRRCVASGFRTTQRVRVRVPAGSPSATTRIRLPQAGGYRIEARLNGDRPAPPAAVQHVVVTGASNPAPRLLSAQYGHFRPAGAPKGYDALKLRMLDADGQVVALNWRQLEPPVSPERIGFADGVCGLGTNRNGAVATWYLPVTLDRGHYRFGFELGSSPCGGKGKPQTVRQAVSVDVP
jgi:hypothetical protein